MSLLLYLEPVVSVAGAALLLGERVSLVMLGGGALILAGVAVSGTGRRPGTEHESGPMTAALMAGEPPREPR